MFVPYLRLKTLLSTTISLFGKDADTFVLVYYVSYFSKLTADDAYELLLQFSLFEKLAMLITMPNS